MLNNLNYNEIVFINNEINDRAVVLKTNVQQNYVQIILIDNIQKTILLELRTFYNNIYYILQPVNTYSDKIPVIIMEEGVNKFTDGNNIFVCSDEKTISSFINISQNIIYISDTNYTIYIYNSHWNIYKHNKCSFKTKKMIKLMLFVYEHLTVRICEDVMANILENIQMYT
jgi:hypothetical protein